MGAILPRQPQQLKLKPQLLVGVAFWVGVSLVADANRKPLQPPRQRQRLPPQQLLPLQQLPQPNVEVLLVVVYWAAKHFIQCYNEQVLFKFYRKLRSKLPWMTSPTKSTVQG